ncbi:hypothetical protein MATL_G00084170 [Megalops atlanticus]|uniref:CD8 beta n=1 Tax=Megalops atlanticus TaxID=7932 RepID=A0A9D3Q7V4_MEGAT|nr:hypothetical protein MATL_G00084170 [Megalops atlanticus]
MSRHRAGGPGLWTMAWLVHLWIVCVWTAVAGESLPAVETQYSRLGGFKEFRVQMLKQELPGGVLVPKEDAGGYFCILRFFGENKLGSRGIELKPGQKPPTQPPPTTTRKAHKRPKSCNCPGNTHPKQEFRCQPLFLWILGGVLGTFVTALISVLFYFSRLSKKCHHRLAKEQQLR